MPFGVIGLLGVIVGIVMLIVSFIRRKQKKISLIIITACFVLFMVGALLPDSNENSPVVDGSSETPAPSSAIIAPSQPANPTADNKPTESDDLKTPEPSVPSMTVS